MTPEIPATGILLQSKYDDSERYVIPCTCGCEASVNFTISVEKDTGLITSYLESKTTTDHWSQVIDITYKESWFVISLKSMINDWANRISVAWKALSGGVVETHSYVLLDQQQALNFAETVKNAVVNFEKRQLP